jgi:hypothetical protein
MCGIGWYNSCEGYVNSIERELLGNLSTGGRDLDAGVNTHVTAAISGAARGGSKALKPAIPNVIPSTTEYDGVVLSPKVKKRETDLSWLPFHCWRWDSY